MKYKKTATRMKMALDDCGMKPVELSELTGVAQPSISHYLTGLHTPSNENAVKIGKVLGCNALWLMGYDVPRDSAFPPEAPEKTAEEIAQLAADLKMMEALKFYLKLPEDKKKRAAEMLRLFCTE